MVTSSTHLLGGGNLQLGVLGSLDDQDSLVLEHLKAADVLVGDVGGRRDMASQGGDSIFY